MKHYLVSVIIPTYCPKEYLWDCLDSLRLQTLPKEAFEVVVVLNGQEEPYRTQIEAYRLRYPELHLRLEQAEPAGAARARNVGLDVAEGTFILFIDDDDFVSPMCLEEMLTLADDRFIAVCYPYSFQDGALGVQCPYKLTEAYDVCSPQPYASVIGMARQFLSGPCMKLIARSIIGDRRFDSRFKVGEDSLFMFLISDRIQGIRFTSRQSVYYRRLREGSIIHSQGVWHSIRTGVALVREYTRIYWKGNYSTYLYVTRLLGAGHRVLHCLKQKIKHL